VKGPPGLSGSIAPKVATVMPPGVFSGTAEAESVMSVGAALV
jgi:hypothetical protein